MSSKDSNQSFSVSANGEEDNAISFPDRVNIDGFWVPTSYQNNLTRFLPISTQASHNHTETLQSSREHTPVILGWSPQQPINMSSPNNAHNNEDNGSEISYLNEDEFNDTPGGETGLPPAYVDLEGREYLPEESPAGQFRDGNKETIERMLQRIKDEEEDLQALLQAQTNGKILSQSFNQLRLSITSCADYTGHFRKLTLAAEAAGTEVTQPTKEFPGHRLFQAPPWFQLAVIRGAISIL